MRPQEECGSVEEARGALRRRAGRPIVEKIRRHRALALSRLVSRVANDWPHRRREMDADALSVPELHCDYCFPKDRVGGDAVVLVVREQG